MRHYIKKNEKIRQITNVSKYIDIEIKKQDLYQIKQFKRNLINLNIDLRKPKMKLK